MIELSFPILAIEAKGEALLEICVQHEAYELCAFIKDLIKGDDTPKQNDFSNIEKGLLETVIDSLEAKKTKSWTLTPEGDTVL